MNNTITTKLAASKLQQLVVFNLAGEDYGVHIGKVSGIEPLHHITTLPRTPEFVVGVIDLRGQVIPVVDMRKVFSLPPFIEAKDSRIVVMNICEQLVGCLVDSVTEVLRIEPDSVAAPSPMITASIGSDYLLGVVNLKDRMIILLDVEKVFTEAQGTELAVIDIPTTEELDAEIEGVSMGYPSTEMQG